ncbi:bysl [Symbiodinium sp. KB8]|nr:bysl [Symbiodinium sp. KB8]
MPKIRVKDNVHQPLGKDMEELESGLVPQRAVRTKRKDQQAARLKQQAEAFVPQKLSKKILDEARKQQMDIEQEESGGQGAKKVHFNVDLGGDDDSDYEDNVEDTGEDMEGFRMRDGYVDVAYNEDDEAAVRRFMPSEAPQRKTLADLIMEKLEEKVRGRGDSMAAKAEQVARGMNPKVVTVYQEVGKFLKSYTHGKLPKAFKLIPKLKNWEEVLYLTDPEGWHPVAYYAATRIFASNLNAAMAQRFYNLILLPKVREDIQANKKLNYHLYTSLKKALYKPGAWYKGILLPLCEDGDCTLREANIISSVLVRVHVPQAHSSAALLKMAHMRYSGAMSIFIRILLNKKYALSSLVINALVEKHFAPFRNVPGPLPVIWHQALLVLAQRYKNSLTTRHKVILRDLMRVHTHRMITPEIRRELFSGEQGREYEGGVAVTTGADGGDMDMETEGGGGGGAGAGAAGGFGAFHTMSM